MYHYYFEGDTVRLAYWRIAYDNDKFMYADTDECKDEIIASLKARGFTPTATEIDQTGNEWIDGECFTDHSMVEDALSRGAKDFICDGDMEEIVNTLTIMNDALFSVDGNNVWHITAPEAPSLSCYSIMTCITASSVDYQKISINGGAALPLYKSASEPVLALDVIATPEKPLAVQINITKDRAFFNVSANSGWSVGEIKTFGYKRAKSPTELLCDGSIYDKDTYPALYSVLKDTYAVPAEFVHTSNLRFLKIIRADDGTLIGIDNSSYVYNSTDGINWTQVNTTLATSANYISNFAYGNGIILCTAGVTKNNSYGTMLYYVKKSIDNGKTWTNFTSQYDIIYSFAYSESENIWSVLSYNTTAATWYTADADFTKLTTTGNTVSNITGSTAHAGSVYSLDGYWLYSVGNSNFIINNARPTTAPRQIHSGIALSSNIYNRHVPSLCVKDKLVYVPSDSYGGNTLYIVDATSYSVIDLGSYKFTEAVYIPEYDSCILVGKSGLVAVDIDNACVKKVSETTIDFSIYFYGATYSHKLHQIVCGTYAGTYTVDIEGFSLPPERDDAFTYIKTE